MKNKNILYNIINFVLIICTLLFIIPMYKDISLDDNNLFTVYESFSIITSFIFFMVCFVMNLVIGILNTKRKNNAISVLNIIIGFIALVNIFFIIIYNGTREDVWAYILFSSQICQIIMTIVILILNRKKEGAKLKKHSIILFCIILIVSIVLVVLPRILFKVNKDKLMEAYNILKKENKPELIIDYDSNFYDLTGNLISNNNYKIIKDLIIDYEGTHIITVMDNNKEMWIVNYNGEKIVRLYYIFSSEYLIHSLIETTDVYYKRYNNSKVEDEINYLTAKTVEDNYMKFTDENKKISIEIEIDKTQIEKDTSFFQLLENYYNENYDWKTNEISAIKGMDLGTIYKYKKNYYLTYENNERIKLDCNNLLIDYNEEDGNYIINLYKNWNIPFYDENENGFYDLKGKKYTINNNYLIYNTFDKFVILYNTLNDYLYISTYDFNDRKKVEYIHYCSENYVYADYNLYKINDDKIETVVEKIQYYISPDYEESYYSSINSVYYKFFY